ncbi:MAG TPA: cytochrome c biogenesis protein CcsA [Planctomycetota bacterium]|nr:cytochrome c biogenesis protein CcsA [Planctomycetota bacterium]
MKRKLSIPIAALLCAASLALCAVTARAESDAPTFKLDDPSWTLDFTNAELLAVQEGRRKKPLQTYAFESIEEIAGRPLFGSTFIKVPAGGDSSDPKFVKLGAMDLYLSLWFYPDYWRDKPLILCANSELRTKLRGKPDSEVIPPKGSWHDEKRLSIVELANSPLGEIVSAAHPKKEGDRTNLEKEAMIVYQRIISLRELMNSDESLRFVPHLTDPQATWFSIDQLRASPGEAEQKIISAFENFKSSYKARNRERFSAASLSLRDSLQTLSPSVYPPEGRMKIEVTYNNLHPFQWAWIFYLFTVIATCFAIRLKPREFYVAAFSLYLIGIAFHVVGFALRCYIAGRPPVSNMYESVIWVGFGAVFFGLIFELKTRKRFYMLSGSFAGFLCLVLMDMIPVVMGGANNGTKSSIEALQPVLRDNFWLTIHVLTITLSYAAFMLAWGMGHISLASHLAHPTENVQHRELHDLVYRVLQVGVLLLATGTILGGVWAYYSWGRFWGWDSKETWALIALLTYIVVLHGRFAGFWTNFGLAFGAVFCFLSVVMAWYGVNFVLGSNLHGYGSGVGGLDLVRGLVAADLLYLSIATWQYLLHRYKNPSSPWYGVGAALLLAGGGFVMQRMGVEGSARHGEWLEWMRRLLSHGDIIGTTLYHFAVVAAIWGVPGVVMRWIYRAKHAALPPEEPQPASGE